MVPSPFFENLQLFLDSILYWNWGNILPWWERSKYCQKKILSMFLLFYPQLWQLAPWSCHRRRRIRRYLLARDPLNMSTQVIWPYYPGNTHRFYDKLLTNIWSLIAQQCLTANKWKSVTDSNDKFEKRFTWMNPTIIVNQFTCAFLIPEVTKTNLEIKR